MFEQEKEEKHFIFFYVFVSFPISETWLTSLPNFYLTFYITFIFIFYEIKKQRFVKENFIAEHLREVLDFENRNMF